MDRRNFFQLASGTAAVTAFLQKTVNRAFAAPAPAKNMSAEEAATDEDFWSQIRNEFTTDRTVINLNNGHVSPAPRTVQDAMRRYLDYSNQGPYHTMIRELSPRRNRPAAWWPKSREWTRKRLPSRATPASPWKSPNSG